MSTTAMLPLGAGIELGAADALIPATLGPARHVQRTKRQPIPRGMARKAPAPEASPAQNAGDSQLAPMIGYASIRRGERGRHRDELRAQLQVIISECRRRGLGLVDIVREREPQRGKSLERPGLDHALRRIANGEVEGLVVAELSRISRSVADLGEVLEWFLRSGARLVAANPGLDTAEKDGRLAARAVMDVSTWERERLSERTRKGLEAARGGGRRRGRAGVADNPELSERIARMRAAGMTLQAIADRLNQDGVPTIRGGALWRPSSVQAAAGYRRPRRRDPWGGAPEPGRPGETGDKEL